MDDDYGGESGGNGDGGLRLDDRFEFLIYKESRIDIAGDRFFLEQKLAEWRYMFAESHIKFLSCYSNVRHTKSYG
ncbi:uncharacterized protein DS421_19g647950 [Arachis hypogaea]|uniref:Uncharacterized protein n=1 Tax=Arachis hypogaea TaxID=3818 RepID=A0A6B9V6A5_ARAHY|nr:uncharacterized protein DS421_19g647950 [Arachis hypogaea]